jgi:uncharacterized protein YndB with AHSA1/START domain
MDGTVHDVEGQYVLRFERHLKHPVEKVWAALTDPERRAEWLAPGTIEPRPGGRAELNFDDGPTPEHGTDLEGTVRIADPQRLLEVTWTTESGREEPVRWELFPEEDGTRLVLTHTVRRSIPLGFGLNVQNSATESRMAGYQAGWHAHLDRLPLMLAGQPSVYSLATWAELYLRYLAAGRARARPGGRPLSVAG